MKRWLSSHRPALRAILAYLDTPISLSIWLKIKYGAWDALALQWCDPQHYPEGVFNALRYRRDVMAVDLLRKAPLPTTIDRRAEALAAWERAETQCFITNEYMVYLRSARASPAERRFDKFLDKVKIRLTRWLGRLPDDLEGGFGPGTCVEYKGSNPTVIDKLWLTPTTTPDAAQLFSVLYGRTHWGRTRASEGLPFQGLSRGNRLTTVPKDGKVDRPISIEPLGNLWLQLGIGRYLKRRLRLCGLPRFGDTDREILPGLNQSYLDAQAVHRELVLSDLRGRYSTIDLSSASDTIAVELVRRLLPDDWFALLDDCRSKFTSVPSEGNARIFRRLEKFSSMGNGFTFELESFIFLALICEAFGLVPGENCWVFGDDIIVPEHIGHSCMNLLEWCGFTPNRRKSYVSGPFRESCGAYCHSGLDCKPVRVTEELDSIPALVSFHNALVGWGFPPAVTTLWETMVPKRWRVYGPSWLGDVVLHGHKWKSIIRPRHGTQTRWVRCLRLKAVDPLCLDRWSPELNLTAVLAGVTTPIERRGARVEPAFTWVSVS